MRVGNRMLTSCKLSSRRSLVSLVTTLALLVMSEQSVEICHDRPFGATCADEAKQPVEESCEPVLESRQEGNVDDEPQEPRKPAREPHSVHADDCTAAIDGGHTPEVPILPRNRLGAVFDAISDDVSCMETRLKRDFGDAREVVAVHHVADCEHFGVARQ